MNGSRTDPAPIDQRMVLRSDQVDVPAGDVTFLASSMGSRAHELVTLPLAPGQAAGSRTPGADGKVDESGNLGEASAPCCAGAGDGLTPGTVGWVTVTLAPGRHELVCNMTNHYADGMWQEFYVLRGCATCDRAGAVSAVPSWPHQLAESRTGAATLAVLMAAPRSGGRHAAIAVTVVAREHEPTTADAAST